MARKPTYEELEQRIRELEKESAKRRQAEKKFSNIVNSSPMGIHMYRLEPDGRLVFTGSNPSANTILGIDNTQFIGKTIEEAFPSLVESEVPERYRDVCASGGIWQTEQINYEDEQIRGAFEVHAFQTAPGMMAAMFLDITERKRTEEALQDAEKRYRDFFNEAPVMYVVTGHHRGEPHVGECNDLFCTTLDYTREQVLNRPLADFYTADSQNQLMQAGYRDVMEGRSVAGERQLLTADGRPIETLIRSVPIFNSENKVIGSRSIYLDITQRKLAEEALRLSEEKFFKAFNASPVWVAISTAKEGRLLEVNDTFTKVTGYTRAEAVGRTSADLNFWLDPENDRPRVLELFHRQGFVRNLEIQMRFKGGKIHDMLWSVDPIVFGGEDCFINVLTDITEFKQLQEEKARLENQLMQAQKMEAIGTLAGGIAHDFNNILSAILGNAEIVLMHELPTGHQARHSIEEVRKAARRARDLVRQILAFSRQKEAEFAEVSLSLIIIEVVQLLRASLPVTIEIQRELAAQSDMIAGDPGRIHQLLMNLCTNAAHAMRQTGGVLAIRLADIGLDAQNASAYPDLEPGPYLKLSISDTGHGMSTEIQARIFEPYFTTKQVGEGTGLGLSVVHGIVKSLGGSIAVKSTRGQGSTFDILLPKIKDQSISERDRHEPMPTGTERILFVDDEKPLTIISKRMLEGLGYSVCAKTDSLEALEEFRADPHGYDLIITDMTMPSMTGDRLAREMINIRPDIPVVLCTGYSESITPEGARSIGIRELVMKPLVMRQLAEIVRRVLDGGMSVKK